MRTKEELDRAEAILRKKYDSISCMQADVIASRQKEQDVFIIYVRDMPENFRNEQAYFAARDAARFVAGSLTLEELIPDADKYPVQETRLIKSAIVGRSMKEPPKASIKDVNALRLRVKMLESTVDELRSEIRCMKNLLNAGREYRMKEEEPRYVIKKQ